MLLYSSISLDVTETNFLYWCVRFAGIPSDLVVPRPALPNCGGPLMVWKANSDSAERTASFTFQLPDFKTGLLAATNGSLESRKSK